MKPKKILLPLFFLVSFIACTHEENNFTESLETSSFSQRNWQNNVLSTAFFIQQQNTSHYHFDKSELVKTLKEKNLTKYRFVMGYDNDHISITLVGMDKNGKEITSLPATMYNNNQEYETALYKIKNSSFSYSKNSLEAPFVGQHLLPYQSVYSYILKWKNLLITKDIENAITDNGIRYRYYTLQKEVVADMIASDSVNSIALFLGLNAQNKLTTVFLQKDKNDQLIFSQDKQQQNKGSDGKAYDFTSPCPNTCD